MAAISGEGTKTSQTPGMSGVIPLKWMLGLFGFLLRSGGELTRLVGEMHHAVSLSPPPFAARTELDSDKAHKTYLLLRLALEYGADHLHQWSATMQSLPNTPQTARRMQAAMNGVMGDKLQAWGNPLRLHMELVDHEGSEVDPDTMQQGKGLVLFVHGLCLSEWDWQGRQHHYFVEEMKQQGFGVAWLRYNTGLPIWENGAALAQLLESVWQGDNERKLVLVGHSMGGLVIRSALHYGSDSDLRWLGDVSHMACLASPHAGAPLEKLGNFANSLLGVSPYSKPLMALGNIRSLGIRSLRHGAIHPSMAEGGEAPASALPESLSVLLLAARIGTDPARHWIGDGLVPVASALSEDHFPPQHAAVKRVLLDDVGHLRLLQDSRTYQSLRDWLAVTAKP